MKKAVAALGEEEVERIVREEGKIEVTCQFCNDTFNFDDVEIEEARHFARVQAEFDKQEEAEEAARFERDLAEVQVSVPCPARRLVCLRTLAAPASAHVCAARRVSSSRARH